MSKWPGKYVIGLTGNIGTGKSVVRRMLEHLGAYGIDADALAHRAIAKGAPGYQPVVETFGRWVIAPDGQIDRARLSKVVFADPSALAELEKIIHPLVNQAIDLLVRRSSQAAIVIEAIKLVESGLGNNCDSLWVTYTPRETQIARLVKNRGMSQANARLRVDTQAPQEQKLAIASVVIKNTGSFITTWRQVQSAWEKLVPQPAVKPAPAAKTEHKLQGELSVIRARPRQSAEIAAFINRLAKDGRILGKEDIMAAFGEKAFLLLMAGSTLAGLLGWQVENLVSRSTDMMIDPAVPLERAIPLLIEEMERASRELQCEASLVFVNEPVVGLAEVWRSLGYEQREPQSLNVQAWQEAALETRPAGSALLFKQLRQDRILRPI